MTLALVIAALGLAIALPIVLPLIRGNARELGAAERERAAYRDQLRELDRDVERGLVTQADVATTRLEIQRRVLAADSGPAEPGTPRSRKSPVLAAIVALCIAGGSAGLYLILGSPVPPSGSGPDARIRHIAGEAAARLRDHPEDAEALTIYARAMSRLERWGDAEEAWRRIVALGRATPEVLASLGELVTLRDGGDVGDEARGLFDLAARGDPKNDVARYYLALAAFQAGDVVGALTQWQALLGDMAADAPGRQEVIRRMETAARTAGVPLPQADDNELGRAAAIDAMVAKLAARLAEHPDDAEGWTRLGRSYAVLGRSEASADAYEKAAALKPGDVTPKRAAAEALLAHLRPEDPLPPRAVALLRQVETVLPEDPAVLWYLGLLAARDRDFATARGYWTRLGKVLPPDGPDAKMVQAALAALSGGH